MDRSIRHRTAHGSSWLRSLILVAGLALVAGSTSAFASEPCGTGSYPFPYTDVVSVTDPFCPGIMEAYVTGISKGTTPTTFSPNNDVIRLQMTTFLQRTVDQVLTRGSRRAALNQWWIPQDTNAMQTITVGGGPASQSCVADGANIWISNGIGVVKVEASTGTILGTWTGATNGAGILAAAGKIFVPSFSLPGKLYVIDPTQSPGPVTVSPNDLGDNVVGIAFDGTKIWTANFGSPGSVSIIDPVSFTVTTVSAGFNELWGVVYDGAYIWVTDFIAGTLLKLDATGNVLQTVIVGAGPTIPVFDGANIWVPSYGSNSVTVVQASTGNVVATISGDATNMLNHPEQVSFDGERVLVTNFGSDSVTVYKAADLSFIANVATGTSTGPWGTCSDAINFWVTLSDIGELLRF